MRSLRRAARFGVLAAALCGAPYAAAQGNGPIVLVETVTAETFVNRVEALGTLRANERVDLTALVTEQIETLHFDDGAAVGRGDMLVGLVRREEQAQLEEAEATLLEARDQLTRAEGLARTAAGSETTLGLRRREFKVAEAQLEAAKAQLADRVITAPFDGRVGIRTLSAGATVAPGDVIATLIDDSVMKLDFSVPSTFLAALSPGASIEARTRAYPGLVFEGRVASIDAEVDPVTRSVLVRALLPNEGGRLKTGLLMEVELLLEQRQALLAPEESVIPFGDETFVLVVVEKDGAAHAERRRVTIGGRRVGEVEIVDGLAEGDRVLTEGGLKVRPGQRIRPQAAPPPTETGAATAASAREG